VTPRSPSRRSSRSPDPTGSGDPKRTTARRAARAKRKTKGVAWRPPEASAGLRPDLERLPAEREQRRRAARSTASRSQRVPSQHRQLACTATVRQHCFARDQNRPKPHRTHPRPVRHGFCETDVGAAREPAATASRERRGDCVGGQPGAGHLQAGRPVLGSHVTNTGVCGPQSGTLVGLSESRATRAQPANQTVSVSPSPGTSLPVRRVRHNDAIETPYVAGTAPVPATRIFAPGGCHE